MDHDENPSEGKAFNTLPKAQIAHELALLKLQPYIAANSNVSAKHLVQQYVDYYTDILLELDKLP